MSTATPYQIATQTTSTGGSGSDAQWHFAQRVNVDIATNMNNLTQTTVPIDGALFTSGTGWAINGSGIELTGPGLTNELIRVSFSVHVTGAFNRGNMILRASLNGALFGPIAAHGYIRNNSGHQESSYVISGTWVEMNTGDIITVESLREAAAGTLTMAAAGTSQLLLERLVNV